MERETSLGRLPMPDLARLNATEVQVLRLLADGHTAKSIAILTDRSVASVNERLRQARRKTGASSSRELARFLKAQRGGHEKIELGNSPIASPKGPSFRMGALVVGTLILVAAIAVVTQQSPNTTQAPPAEGDPILNGVLGPGDFEPRYLAQLMRNEQRDAEWAGRLEGSLRERFSSGADGHVQLAKVTCAQTVCEVIGKIDDTELKVAERTAQKLQDPVFNSVTADTKHVAIAFSRDGFASYWKRH